jgi:hypothetical protein
MPYIIETRYAPGTAEYAAKLPPKSRYAVATLDEAREITLEAIGATCEAYPQSDGEDDALDATISLPESGGTIGPLPDGTVIQVQLVR